jgi:DNA processing protein
MKAQGLNFSPGIMVLGSGVLFIYPKQNIELAEHLLSLGGIIMSEYGVFTAPLDYHFPARNRIISGLSTGVVIIEAKEKSGSLITARFAMEQGRDVFVVPGDINNSNCSGSNRLIQQGAALVTCTEDILNCLPQIKSAQAKLVNIANDSGANGATNDTPGEILNLIRTRNNCSLDDIVETLSISPGIAVSCLNKLELEQLIFVHPGNIYSMDRFI